MKPGITELVERLQDPSATSSLFPLLIVITLLTVSILFMGIKLAFRLKLWSVLRREQETIRIRAAETIVIPPGPLGKFRHFFRLVYDTATGNRTHNDSTAITELRAHIDRLEKALALERELHSRTVRKLTEVQSENQTLTERFKALSTASEAETDRRMRTQEKVEELEQRLREAASEVERIYRSSAATAAQNQTREPEGLKKLMQEFETARQSESSDPSRMGKLREVLERSAERLPSDPLKPDTESEDS